MTAEPTDGLGVSVVTGAPGMGRTTTLRRLAAALPGHVVLFVTCRPGASAAAEVLRLARQAGRGDGHGDGASGGSATLDESREPHETGDLLLDAFTRLPPDRPVALLLDDVHLADGPSTLGIGYALRRLYGRRLHVVVTAAVPADHTGDGAADDPDTALQRLWPAHGDVLHLRLGGLTTTDVRRLARATGVEPLLAGDARRIRDRCAGNPREVLRVLGELRGDPHARVRPVSVPWHLATVIESRLAVLGPDSRALLAALAVLDERSPLPAVARVAGVAEPLPALEPLLASGLVTWWPAEPTTPLRIVGPHVRRAAYEGIEPLDRRLLHHRAAAVTASARALAHRTSAASGIPDAALAADLTAAAWRWAGEGDFACAARDMRRAADVGAPGPDSDERLLFAVVLLHRAIEHDEIALLRGRVQDCAPSALRDCVLGRYAMGDGDLAMAETWLERGISAAEHALRRDGSGDRAATMARVRQVGLNWLALLHVWAGRPHQAHATALRAMTDDRAITDDRAMADEGVGAGPGAGGQDGAGAGADPERDPEVDRKLGAAVRLAFIDSTSEITGPDAGLRELARWGTLPAAPGEADPGDYRLLVLRGRLRILAGEPAAGVADLEAALRTRRATRPGHLDEWGLCWTAIGHGVLGAWDRAHEHAVVALDLTHGDGRPDAATMLALNAHVAAGAGRLTAAAEHAAAAAELAHEHGLPAGRALAAHALAAVARARGDHHGVVAALRPLADGDTLGTWRWLWLPTYIEALLALDRTTEARAALAVLADDVATGCRVLAAAGHVLAARLAEAAGDIDAAIADYAAATLVPAGHGGLEWRAAAAAGRQRLARRGAGSRLDSLTERERAVARLIADGSTNKVVSDRLGVTEKTVEAHLTRVYRKLGVRSRAELRAFLGTRRRWQPGANGAVPTGVRRATSCARSGNRGC